mmetsp:Transcript_83520/g.235548  ORF Transcript_83520/g.235548 Transcript_83520/m.235548 type:complete len:410 (-) Transcript_83520:127-1356(-)|eukprot:CAMPEP_0119532294 /NCGR_PEP_ID=MMETSP1344-20130328/45843_1 /TAXON_ID=236787 /ORGANISM="Florenciella parvula, Strain CCMP2471" /LENGTH=409 /DNA_ID=CAMNT_0007572773 /DNA_START=146 /DNA_END=1375 /DNA_ORIENTATION=+
MELNFVVDARHHGKGKIVYAWHPSGQFVATTGTSRVVHIFNCNGQVVDQIVLPSASICTALQWDRYGDVLAILQASSQIVVLWQMKTREMRHLDTNYKDLTFMRWAPSGDLLALGTAKGALLIYNQKTGKKKEASGRHKKRIVCGDWNEDDTLAYASEDRQITICRADGETIDQVKVKCRPQSVSFGGKQNAQGSIVSVNMEGRTILLYNLLEKDNALELAFQARYGNIVSYRWFGDGYIMAGFSSGFVVVISTHMHEIGREQYCAKFHDDQLRDIAHCPVTNRVACCGDKCVKLIDMDDWKEISAHVLEKEASTLDSLAWADDGKILSVSSRSGCLYTFVIRSGNDDQLAGRLNPHSVVANALRPLPAHGMAALVVVLVALLLTGACWHLDVGLADLLRALLGTSEVA